MTCYSFNSIVAAGGNTLDNNFCIFQVFEHLVAWHPHGNGPHRFWKILQWSFDALFAGKWPTADPDGNPILSGKAGADLAGGLRAMVLCLKGDWDYHYKDHGKERVGCCLRTGEGGSWQ